MTLSGANLENISREIVYSVFCHFSCKPHGIITFLILVIHNINISKTKNIPKRTFHINKSSKNTGINDAKF